jgi:two-component system, sensor histidine kinase LadS
LLFKVLFFVTSWQFSGIAYRFGREAFSYTPYMSCAISSLEQQNNRMMNFQSRILKLLMAFFTLTLLHTWALAQAHAQSSAAATRPDIAVAYLYFLDPTGKKTVDQIEQLASTEFARFQPEKPIAIKGGALWLRFDAISQNNQQSGRLILPMATVDDVTLFNRAADGQWIKQHGGDTRPMSTWAQPGRYPSFELSHDMGRQVSYLLQVRHERGLFSTLPRIMNESAFITSRQNEHLVLGMYFGLAALVVILALTRAVVYRDTGFGSYAVYVALLALTIATVSGISALYLWPEWPYSTVMSPVLATLTGVAADWFVRVVTRPKRFSRWLDRALLGMIFIAPLGGLLTIFQPSGWAYTVYSSLILLNGFVLLSAIVGALWQGDHDSRWVAFGFLPIVLAIFVTLSRNFGLIPASALTELMIPVASAVEVVILFYGLHRRVSQPRSVATRVTRLLNIDPLTGLSTNHALVGRLGSALKLAQRTQQTYALVVIDLANADAMETQFGREVADRAMVLAASCIRSVISSEETLARAGPSQFALLMEGPVDRLAASDIATKILANALRVSQGMPEGQSLRFHIALGHPITPIISTSRDAAPILAKLVDAASKMDVDSRKTIRVVEVA